MHRFLLLPFLLLSAVNSSQFWVTTVITEFRVRDQCSEFWNRTGACSDPFLRISTDINRPTQFATRAWRIQDVVDMTEKPSFISQWHGSLDSVRVSAQIEGGNQLNPFGLVPKCDQGFHPKIAFNQSSEDVFERLSVRIILIEAQCFSAKILVKMDTECPYCPPPTTTTQIAPTTVSSMFTRQNLLIGCAASFCFACLLLVIFLLTLRKVLRRRRENGFQTCPSLESGLSSIPEKHEDPVDFFSVLPPLIEYEELNLDESIDIYGLPRLGSLVYSLDASVSDPVYV